MKLLKITASNFKNCKKDYSIDLVAKAKKTAEDKEYELQEIAPGLFVLNTIVFVGKNASGKTTAVELLDCGYSILNSFSLDNKPYSYENVSLEIFFYQEGYIYKYNTLLATAKDLSNKATFKNQKLERKPYFKTNSKEIYDSADFSPVDNITLLPEDTSIVFFVLKHKTTNALYYNCEGYGSDTYRILFKTLNQYHLSDSIISDILQIFDQNLSSLIMIDANHYELTYYPSNKKIVSDSELFQILSSGTTKGLLLYLLVIASLQNGFDLIIDEIENHFHRTLIKNILSLYKDKSVNKYNATIMFTTHYGEILDLFNRQDNIYICLPGNKVSLRNMYSDHKVRSELLKSKQVFNKTLDTNVDYEALMRLKKELMNGETINNVRGKQ